MNPLQGESSISKPLHAARARISSPGPYHGALTAKPSSHHVHVPLWVTPPISPCPTISANAELCTQRAKTIFSDAQYDVTKSAL